MIAYHNGHDLDTLSQAGARARRGAREGGMVAAMGKRRELQKMKNSGNEAKKYLKTKHITFLSSANYARFAHELAQIGARNEQKLHNLQKRTEDSERQGEAMRVTRNRLHRIAAYEPTTLSPGRARCYRRFVLLLPAAERPQRCCRTSKLNERTGNVCENKGSELGRTRYARSADL